MDFLFFWEFLNIYTNQLPWQPIYHTSIPISQVMSYEVLNPNNDLFKFCWHKDQNAVTYIENTVQAKNTGQT